MRKYRCSTKSGGELVRVRDILCNPYELGMAENEDMPIIKPWAFAFLCHNNMSINPCNYHITIAAVSPAIPGSIVWQSSVTAKSIAQSMTSTCCHAYWWLWGGGRQSQRDEFLDVSGKLQQRGLSGLIVGGCSKGLGHRNRMPFRPCWP